MNRPRSKSPTSSGDTAAPSSIATATRSLTSNAAPFRTSPPAGPPNWADTSSSATGADTGRSPTIPAATVTAPSARPPPPPTGWRPGKPNCCPSNTSTSSSPCRQRSDPIALQNPRVVYGLLVPGRRRDPAAGRRRPRAPRGRDRLPGRPPHLGPEPAAPPPRPLRRPRRRDLARRLALGPLPAGILPPGPRAQPRLPGEVPRPAQGRLRPGAALLPRQAQPAGRPGRIPTPARRQCQDRVGRLRQATLRRTGTGAQVPGPVHPPRGHQQPPAHRPGRRRGHLPVEGLRRRQGAEDDEPQGRPSSSADSSCTSCRRDSCGSGTTASWPTGSAGRSWDCAATCWRPSRHPPGPGRSLGSKETVEGRPEAHACPACGEGPDGHRRDLAGGPGPSERRGRAGADDRAGRHGYVLSLQRGEGPTG